MEFLISLVICSVLFLPLVTGQCNIRSVPCEPVCHCNNTNRCQSYTSNSGCGSDGCWTGFSGQFCQIENIVYGLKGDGKLGSSRDFVYRPEFAVDGDVSTSFVSSSVRNPYLWINTGGYNVINKLRITSELLQNFQIDVSNGSDFKNKKQCQYRRDFSTPQPLYSLTCTPPVIGQYVRIQLQGSTPKILRIRELEIYGCADYWYGGQCDRLCNCQNATEVCDKMTGSCWSGCAAGYAGTDCQARCENSRYGSGCKFTCGRCKSNSPCNEVDGICTQGCVTGFAGGKCKECERGLYDINCDSPCGHCLNSQQCVKSTGNCPNGCEAGYTGQGCSDECRDGYYGINCGNKCGHCASGGVCNKDNGHCTNGCEGMFTGDLCKECRSGSYGQNCTGTCGHCFGSMGCHKSNGRCPEGCNPGYQGPLCKDECKCNTFGVNCTGTCHCANNVSCDIQTGEYEGGACAHGYTGPLCQQALRVGKELSGCALYGNGFWVKCSDSDISVYVGLTVTFGAASLTLAVLLVILLILLRKYRPVYMAELKRRAENYQMPVGSLTSATFYEQLQY